MSDVAKQLLTEEEGRKVQPYYDSKGLGTVGVGHLVDPRRVCPMPGEIIDRLFEIDFDEKSLQAEQVPGFDRLNEVQKAVIVSMVFQMGMEPFDGDGVKDFTKMLGALAKGDVKRAANEGRDSKWAKFDTPTRAERQMKMLESGLWVPRS